MTAFEALFAEVVGDSGRFGHREHLHVTWLAVRRFGTAAAVELISDGIRRTATYAGAPQKYHATVSRAWVELVACHSKPDNEPDNEPGGKPDNEPGGKPGNEPGKGPDSGPGGDDFDVFLARHPALLDKRLLTRFYRSGTLASVAARSGWVEPDLHPIPA